jgi:ribonuclease BN (tRNA processing enzyme)
MRRLLEAKTTIFDLDYVFYSHFHPDHSAELVPLIFATKYPDENRRQFPLTVVAGRGLTAFVAGLKAVYGKWIELAGGLLAFMELDNHRPVSRKFSDFVVDSVPVDHNPESIAYRITSGDGSSVVYSGDTDFSENLIGLARDADLLICESALPDSMPVKGIHNGLYPFPGQSVRLGIQAYVLCVRDLFNANNYVHVKFSFAVFSQRCKNFPMSLDLFGIFLVQLLANYIALDLICSFIYLKNFCIPHHLLHGIFTHVAVAT